jgi:hypothetical protein
MAIDISKRDVETEYCKCVSTFMSRCGNVSNSHNMWERRVVMVDVYWEISNETQNTLTAEFRITRICYVSKTIIFIPIL